MQYWQPNELLEGINGGTEGIMINVFGRTKEAFSEMWWKESAKVGRSQILMWRVSERLIQN